MRVICTAVVNDGLQRQNLIECTKIIGVKPQVSGFSVCAEYEGSSSVCDKLVELYAQYPFHGISTLN